MKQKLMSLLLCPILTASSALRATVYGEEFFSEEALIPRRIPRLREIYP